jgi:hypothetical protein
MSNFSSAFTMTVEMTTSLNQLLFAGTRYQAAQLVLVFCKISNCNSFRVAALPALQYR